MKLEELRDLPTEKREEATENLSRTEGRNQEKTELNIEREDK